MALASAGESAMNPACYHGAEQEAAAWADTFRTALMMIKASRDHDTDAYWILFEGVPEDRGPLLVKLLALFGAVGRDDEWFQARLERITEAEASRDLLAKVHDWIRETM